MTSSAWVEPARSKWRVRGFVRGKRATIQSGFATRSEAERFARLIADEGAAFVDPGAVTLASWGADWFARREADGVRGIRQERSAWARHVEPSDLASLPIESITAPIVVDWLDATRRTKKTRTVRRKGGVEIVETSETISPQTVRHALRLVSSALDDAVKRGIVASNPAAVVSLPRQAKKTTRAEPWTFLSADEIARVQALPEDRRALFVVAIFTGLRLGELLALRWDDIEWDRERLRVRRSKNGKGRTVPLLAPALAALETVQATRTGRQASSPLVFCRPDGRAFADGYDGGWGDRWCARAGIDRPVRFHDLRHTCASHLVMGTWGRALRLDEARAWLGHSSITVTQRYAHFGDGHLDELARTMDAPPATSHAASHGGTENAVLSGKVDDSDRPSKPTVERSNRSGGAKENEKARGLVWEVPPTLQTLARAVLDVADASPVAAVAVAVELARAVLGATEPDRVKTDTCQK